MLEWTIILWSFCTTKKNKPVPIRVTKLRHQVGDLSFMVKQIMGKQNLQTVWPDTQCQSKGLSKRKGKDTWWTRERIQSS